jgi:hypothetical protein
MAIKLDARFLKDHGYAALTKEQADILLRTVYDTAELILGAELSERMTSHQLDQFSEFIESSDESGALAWLERTFPAYRDTVQEVFRMIGAELRATSSQIRADTNTPESSGHRQ